MVLRVRDRQGNILYRHKPKRQTVVDQKVVEDLHRMLRLVVTHGTGRAAAQGWPSACAAGKTGTSDDYRDAWFAGYTPSLSCVVSPLATPL
eukprot:3266670-Pyramimonas_sp.AAC.1